MSARAQAGGEVSVGQVFEDFPFTRAHVKACLCLFFTFVIDAWESMVIVYCSDSIRRDLDIGPVALGNLIGAIFIGMALGALFWGRLSNRIGRKPALVWSLALYGVISMASAFAPDYASLYVLRLLAGFVVIGTGVITFPYFEELLPVRLRGAATVFLSAGWPVGVLIALAVSHAWSEHGWRWVIGISSLGGLWALVVWKVMPESPYWLAGSGRQREAREVLRRLGGPGLALPEGSLHVDAVSRVPVLEVLRSPLLRLTLLQCLLNFAFAWGYWGLQTWLPTLLQQRGLDLPQSYGFIAISALCMIPGYLSAAWATHRYGRKWVMVFYVAMATLCGFLFAASGDMAMLYASNFAMVFFSQGAWGVWNTWMVELYDTRVRTIGYGWGVVAQRLSNILAPIVIGFLVAAGSGFVAIVTFINAFMAVTVMVALLLPETEGHRLE